VTRLKNGEGGEGARARAGTGEGEGEEEGMGGGREESQEARTFLCRVKRVVPLSCGIGITKILNSHTECRT